ncbi:MAG: GNAT family N-acetyltransferase, partial [Dysgonamonadaceae bacterium]|nr:GNAT family N-acetyltransferase [Dysgonamonadaceae bacterium]
MLEIISIDEAGKWDAAVRSMNQYDFYHLAAYHRLDALGKAFLLHYHTGNTAFAWPFILREIPNTGYYDITSVYGYAGPLCNQKNLSTEAITCFQQAIYSYFDEQKIVSVFARLHPLLEQKNILQNLGQVADANLTVGIDLNLPENEQRQQYARSLKTQLNRLKNSGLKIETAHTKEEIDAFIQIYIETMNRVKASSYYYFPPGYFYRFLSEIDSALFLAKYNEEIVSGSLCTFANNIMQAHLNATKDAFLPQSPLKLVLDFARQEGMKRGMKILHLGGGKGGSNDS